MKNTDEAKIAATADVYRLLSACFYQPDEMFVAEDMFGQLETALALCAPQIQGKGTLLGVGFREETLDALLLDYTRLFLGPLEIIAKPYGSVYLDGPKIVMGDSTINALACYEQGGFSPAEDFKEMPDHIAIELEFLYLLCFREAQALGEKNTAAAAEYKTIRRGFLHNHLGRWAAEFSNKICDGASSNFYKNLGELLDGFIQQEQRG